MITYIYELTEGNHNVRKVATYTLPPKRALVCYIMQHVNNNFNTWEYPDIIKGMRESDTVSGYWYYDKFAKTPTDTNSVLAAYTI